MNEIENYWNIIHSSDEEIRENVLQAWIDYRQNNPHYLNKIKRKFTKKSLNYYKKMNFHTFQVHNIAITCKADSQIKTRIKLNLQKGYKGFGRGYSFDFVYHDVKQYTVCISPAPDVLSVDGDIFDMGKDKLLRHRIAFAGGAHIEIVCKKIEIVRIGFPISQGRTHRL